MKNFSTQSGYVALLAVLVGGAISLAIATALLITGTNSQRETLIQQQSIQARQQATACAEEALQIIHDDTDYAGTGNLTLGTSSCNYTVTNLGGSSRRIDASSTVNTVVRNIQIMLTVGSTIAVTSWQDSLGSGAGSVAHVQTNISANNAASAANVSQAFGSNNTAGNIIVAAVTWFGPGTITCSDSRGNSYTTVRVALDSSENQSLGVCYALNVAAGANTVTGTFSGGASTFRAISVSEFSGIATTGALDVHAGVGGGSGTAVSSSAVSTTQNNDLVYGVVIDTSGTNWNETGITAGSGFTEHGETDGLSPESQVQTTAGSIAASWTFAVSSRYNAIVATFKAANP